MVLVVLPVEPVLLSTAVSGGLIDGPGEASWIYHQHLICLLECHLTGLDPQIVRYNVYGVGL